MDIIIYLPLVAMFYLAFHKTINGLFGCRHDWGNWEHYLLTMQKRKCKKCGLRQERD